ncbi:hypothetical protein [Rubripirellula reticaptiva]|uniref:Uncharacterized protein n=1 Tax=Rubripirellula reticaptiva TaxID=2528013 RepID=A0A5C6FCG9_9BACT|nr:hypothetical protein [Rubripirellula reticaptiva]TWU58327.1 hypothetical protein Poly59_12380 [Rubripirellula reticaptiva]
MSVKEKSGVPADVSLSSADGRLNVVFQWRADRFVQSVFVDGIHAGDSVDGDGETDWPPSPPIQQLSLEEIGGSAVILGVGAAGQGHWSISVEKAGDSSLKFDLACQCRGQAGSLGSTYQTSNSFGLSVSNGDFEAIEPGIVRAAADSNAPDPKNSGPNASTVRWTYQLDAT